MDYQDAIRKAMLAAGLLIIGTSPAHVVMAQDGPQFSLPLDCSERVTCLVQNMVDMDVGRDQNDPHCGGATYDGHKGTDIRLRNLAEMLDGVAVFAMADGVVTSSRDGVDDHLVQTDEDRNRVRGRECGNGLVIDHGLMDGVRYSTKYCHMARNSLKVNKGEVVKRGQKIGRVGLSGSTQFPHIHFSIRQNGKVVDPFTGRQQGQVCDAFGTANTLFSDAALTTLLEKGFEPLMEDGFAGGAVSGETLLAGNVLAPVSPGPLVYYASFINLKKGDSVRLIVIGPDGVLVRRQTKPLARNKATFTTYVGRKSGIDRGTYTGRADLVRGGKTVFSHISNQFHLNK